MKTNAAVCVQMAGMALIAGVGWKCTLLILFYVLTLSWILCIAPDIRNTKIIIFSFFVRRM